VAEEGKKKSKFVKNLKYYVLALVVMLFLIKLNKTVFFIFLFSIAAYILKYIRGMFGLKVVVLDTLHFSAIMLAKFIGIKEAIIFVAINTLAIDFVTFIASDGTFANFFFYSVSTAAAVAIFGNAPMILYGSIAALMYSVLYFIYRTVIIQNPPFDVISKCITSFIFTFLYISFLGPLFALIMA